MNNSDVTFHTHAKFGHNDEIEKILSHKKFVGNTILWICYFIFRSAWIFFYKTPVSDNVMHFFVHFWEKSSQSMAVFFRHFYQYAELSTFEISP